MTTYGLGPAYDLQMAARALELWARVADDAPPDEYARGRLREQRDEIVRLVGELAPDEDEEVGPRRMPWSRGAGAGRIPRREFQ